VGEDVRVDAVEQARFHIIGLGRKQFLRDARPQHDPAFEMVLLHHRLDRDRGGDLERHAAIVPLAMARRALDHRLQVGRARILRDAEQAILVAAHRDQRTALAPGRGPG
jgi:hypothetical protein